MDAPNDVVEKNGWRLVPEQPTPKMLGAMRKASITRHADMYRAAIAASPYSGADNELREAAEGAQAFIGVMFGKGRDAVIPEIVMTPLGIPVKVGDIYRALESALWSTEKAKAK